MGVQEGRSSFLQKRSKKLLRALSPFAGSGTGLLACFLAACTTPPPATFTTADHAASLPIGRNDAGEACTQDGQPGDATASIYCGSWEQPSARVARADTPGATLAGITAAGTWREALDRRMSCETPQPATVLGRYQAVVLSCTTRLGGWPQIALAAQVEGRLWLADGVRPALPAMERSIGVLSGTVPPGTIAAQPVSTALTARRLVAVTYGSNDINHYEALIRAANRANVEGNYAAAEAALRAAASLQGAHTGCQLPGPEQNLCERGLAAVRPGALRHRRGAVRPGRHTGRLPRPE